MEYVVVYGRFVDDKQEGVYLEGIYFGGVAEDQNTADSIAASCVNNAKRGTSFPKILPFSAGGLPSVLNDATCKFAKLEAEMIEAEDIQRANTEMAKRRRTK